MSGPEKNLWIWLRDGVKPQIAEGRLHICRIETITMVGYPDVEGCLDSHNFHIELKAVERPKRQGTPLRIRIQPGQVPWLKKRWKAGGACSVLVRVGSGHSARHYLIAGREAWELLQPIHESRLLELSVKFPDTTPFQIVTAASHCHK